MSILVTATRYNSLRTRIQKVLGSSTSTDPQFGYGQTINSSSVTGNFNLNQTNTSLVDADQYRDLYIDIVRARVHQIGSTAFVQQPFVVGDFDLNGSSTDKIRESYISGLESLMTSIESDKFLIFESEQATVEPIKNAAGFNVQGSRLQSSVGTWNRTLSFIFTVTFSSAAARREFFNAGGQIRIAANQEGSTVNDKTAAWRNLLQSVGQIAFNATRTYSTVSFGAGSNIGNYSLGSTYQLIYRGIGGSSGIYTYSGNFFEVYALQSSATQIQFRVYLSDSEAENTDEPVYGNFYVTPTILRPQGSVIINSSVVPTVVISAAPIGTIITDLTQI